MATNQNCKNCDAPLESNYTYCPKCGQEASDNLTFGVLFSNTISNYFSVDARFFRSFIPLMLKPGVLARRFVDGKRLSYLHPAQFYLFVSVLFFFLFSFNVREADNEMSKAFQNSIERDRSVDSVKITKNDSLEIAKAKEFWDKNKNQMGIPEKDAKLVDSIITDVVGNPERMNSGINLNFDEVALDSLITVGASKEEKLTAMGMEAGTTGLTKRVYEQILKMYEQRGVGLIQTLLDTIPIAMFLLMPLFALLLKIFYWRRGNFAHHMVFSFYFFTFLFTAFSLVILANLIVDVPTWIEVIFTLSILIYLILALRNFYKSSWLGAIIKANIISFAYMTFILPIAVIGIAIMAFMLY